ncbi:hypothetical protein [Halorussus amylolyticus]|uniref:hypothetical protein n=1 Tax=Halorussus amylolyticus TaxID=1126242 RepID=UPI00105203EF|nr:hypothetical protein [Halorussus amylolyticus]
MNFGGLRLGIGLGTGLTFGSTVALGTPTLGAVVALAVVAASVLKFAPMNRVRAAGIGTATVAVAGAAVPVVAFESEWTADLASGTAYALAVFGALVVLWVGIEALDAATAQSR